MARIVGPSPISVPAPTPIPSRAGVSPIGTVSPNSSAMANTNSTYAVGAFTSGITSLGSATAYTLQSTDYQGVIQFNSASACTLTLNSNVSDNFSCDLLNFNTGAITLTTSDGSLINEGSSSLTLASMQGCTVYFADGAWTAYVGSTVIPVTPDTIAATAGVYLTGYDTTTGDWTVNGTAGISATIVTAKLTGGGANGSMTFVAGLLTASTPAT